MAGIEKIKFKPAARPVDTVAVDTNWTRLPEPVAPVKPIAPMQEQLPQAPRKSNVDQLLTALSTLSQSVGQFAGQWAKEQQAEDTTDAELAFMRDNSVDSWATAVQKDPSLADRSPVFRQVFESRIAKTQVQKRAGELMNEYFSSELANSTDPAAIQGWLSERMRDLLDSQTNPAARQALVEEIQSVSGKFINAHYENARTNLIQKNRESVSSEIQSRVDNYAAQGVAVPYQTDDPAGKDAIIASDEKYGRIKVAFLNATAGGESAGKYNIRYDGGSGSLFELNGQHPRIKVRITKGPNAGLTSDASGRYQFLSSTWDEIMGKDTPFTPENQDRAALLLAERDYARRTRRNLWEDMEKEGFSPRIQAALAGTWEALQANKGRHLATYNASLQKYGGEPKGPGAQNAFIPEIQEEIHKIEFMARKQGMPGKEVNSLVLTSVLNAAEKHGDESILEVLNGTRPDGTPMPGRFAENQDAIEAARKRIRSAREQEVELKWKLWKRQREIRKDSVKQQLMDTLFKDMKQNKPPRIDPDVLRTLNAEDPEIAEEAIKVQKNLDDINKVQDPLEVAQLQARAYSGNATPTDVWGWVRDGKIKDNGTITNLMEQASRNVNKAVVNNPVVKPIIDTIEQVVGEKNLPGILQKPIEGAQALSAFNQALIQWQEQNPGRNDAELLEFAIQQRDRLIKIYRPDIDLEATKPENYRAPGTPAKGAATAPGKPGEKPGEKQTFNRIAPNASVAWKKVPIYPDEKTLDEEITRALQHNERNDFRLWMESLGLTTAESVKEFVATQRQLIKNRPKKGN